MKKESDYLRGVSLLFFLTLTFHAAYAQLLYPVPETPRDPDTGLQFNFSFPERQPDTNVQSERKVEETANQAAPLLKLQPETSKKWVDGYVETYYLQNASTAGVRDPTQPPERVLTPLKAVSHVSLRLSATYVSPRISWAVINGVRMKVGDSIGQFTVTGIHSDTVELSGSEGNLEILRLVPDIKKRP